MLLEWVLTAVVGYLMIKHVIQGRLWLLFGGMFLVVLVQYATTLIGWNSSPYNLDGWLALGLGSVILVGWMWWGREKNS